MQIPWDHGLTTLSTVRTIISYIKNPIKTFKDDRKEWLRFYYYRKCKRIGIVKYFINYPKYSIKPDFSDIYKLYNFVISKKPKLILELGGGCSTISLTLALKKNYEENKIKGKLFSIDESKYWQKILINFMPAKLKKFCNFSVKSIMIKKIKGEKVSFYKNILKLKYDMFYIDGGLVDDCDIGGDAIEIEKNASSNFLIIVDGRWKTCLYLKKKLIKKYKFTVDVNFQSVFKPIIK